MPPQSTMVRKAGRVTKEETEARSFPELSQWLHTLSLHHAVRAKGTTFQQDQEDKSPGVEMMLAHGRFGGRKTRPHQNHSRDS